MGKEYLSGQLFTCVGHLGNVTNCGLRSLFQQVSKGKEFLKVGRKLLVVDIPSLNLNTNFEFLRQKSRELLSFEYSAPSYQKFGFQLFADRGA